MRALKMVGAVGVCVLAVACGENPRAAETVTQTVTSAPSTSWVAQPSTPAQGEPAPATAAPTGAPALMPSVVCMNLQAAQDLIQQRGVFFSRSEDASGQGRMQVNDRNWIVVAQRPDPGTPFTEGEAVLSVVKLDEPNSC